MELTRKIVEDMERKVLVDWNTCVEPEYMQKTYYKVLHFVKISSPISPVSAPKSILASLEPARTSRTSLVVAEKALVVLFVCLFLF